MATLNLQKKKIMSESNYKRLINILVGLMASQSTLEEQCLTQYEPVDRVYQRGNITIYNGYIWEAKTVASGTFDESKWTKIGTDSFTELTLDEVKNFLSLTPEQLTTLSSIIKDDSIELSKTWSSSKSYMEIDNALTEAKQYCLTQLASKSTGSFKKATSTAEVTDGNYLYLILNSVTSKYDIYALVDNNVELLTSVDVNLDDYFTKAEIEADFLKKTDADGKFATITTVDGKIDKANIATTISNSPSDEKVASEKAVSDVVSDTAPFKFGIDDKGNYGYYKAGADTVTPFSSGFESIAPEHDETVTYNTDDIVLFNDELYSCTEDGVTGVFKLDKWNKISISDIGGNGSNIGDMELLWTNSDSAYCENNFEVSVDLSKYKYIVCRAFRARAETSTYNIQPYCICKVGEEATVVGTGTASYYRKMTVSDTGVIFTNISNIATNQCIPHEIFGVK